MQRTFVPRGGVGGGGGRVLRILSDGDDRRIFWVQLKFSILGCFWEGNRASIFLGTCSWM